MTRQLLAVPASASTVLAALRRALDGDGPAVLPVEPGASAEGAEVGDRVALVIETSGSTGIPKRVALSAEALLASASGSAAALGGAHHERRSSQWILALPTHYIAGVNVLLRSIVAGTEPLVLPPGPFDPVEFCRLAESTRADEGFAALVPAQLHTLVDAAETSDAVRDTLAGLGGLLVGGQATPAALLQRSAELGIRIVRSYGSSETAGGCLYDGVPFPGVDARIVDGELLVAGPVLAEGYLGDPERTAAIFPRFDGRRWYRTGDTADLADGAVRVTGRADNVIVSGGINISLDRVQRAVREVPGFGDAVVLPVPDERFGEASVIVTAGRGTLDDARTAVEAAVGRHARPVRVLRLETMPVLSSGKPDVRALRELLGSRE